MPQFTIPRLERVIIGPQTVLGTVPNTAGVWTSTAAKLLRTGVNGCQMKAAAPLTPVPWKTGTRSTQPGIVGRKSATWALPSMPVILSGTAGTPADSDILMAAIFGQAAGAVAAAVSVTYGFSDTNFPTFTLARFQHLLAGKSEQFAYGCTVEEASFALNGNVFEMSSSGRAYWALESENFANEDVLGKGGLTAYPLELATPTVVGAIQNGFTGIATFDANVMDPTSAPLIACSLRIRTGTVLYMDNFGNVYASTPGGGERAVSISADFQDSDSAAINNLKVKAKAKTPFNVTLQVGTIAGSICTFNIKSVQLELGNYSDDGARVKTSFGESMAHASAIANIDDVTMVHT
jgi:hypothetical protein